MGLTGIETDLGDYELLDRLAIGGMAEVFVARAADPAAHAGAEKVVVKRLLPRNRADAGFIKLFLDEAKLCVKLRHPHIVRTFKAFKKNADYYMVQELVDGGSLSAVSARLKRKQLRFPPSAAIAVVVSLLKALDYVHRARLGEQHVRLVHRDVNPGNLILGRGGEVKLTDFGVAEGEGIGAKRIEGALRGTPPYMSPEQVRGELVDPRTDVFASGVVLWELLTGRDLFQGESEFETLRRVVEHVPAPPSVYASDLPPALDEICRRALEKDPATRYQSAGELGKALLAAARDAGWGSGDTTLLGTAVTHAMAP